MLLTAMAVVLILFLLLLSWVSQMRQAGEPVESIAYWPLWIVTLILMLVCALLIRAVYVPSESGVGIPGIADGWLMLQGVDAYVGALLLTVAALFTLLFIYRFYCERIWERFSLVTALQMMLMAGLRQLRFYIVQEPLRLGEAAWFVGLGIAIYCLGRIIQSVRGYDWQMGRQLPRPKDEYDYNYRLTRAAFDRVSRPATPQLGRTQSERPKGLRLLLGMLAALLLYMLIRILAPVYRTNGVTGVLEIVIVLTAVILGIVKGVSVLTSSVRVRRHDGRQGPKGTGV